MLEHGTKHTAIGRHHIQSNSYCSTPTQWNKQTLYLVLFMHER